MSSLDIYIVHLYKTLIDFPPESNQTIIKLHTKFLEELGDVSFPLLRKSWLSILPANHDNREESILKYKLCEDDVENSLNRLKILLKDLIQINSLKLINNHVHIFLQRSFIFANHLSYILNLNELYGIYNFFNYNIQLISEEIIDNSDLSISNLSLLRVSILKKVADNLIKLATASSQHNDKNIYIGLHKKQNSPFLTVGPVMNEKGVKNNTNSAIDLINKRTSDMRMMAQHRYQVSIKADSDYQRYFQKLGVSSVTIELLANKPHKPIKVKLNGSSNVNKGPSFIFYNCARISVLLKEFQRKVDENIYTELPDVNKIDVALLDQPEEWEIYFAYILQFPILVKNCIKDIEKEIFNPQNLITFLSNLSATFSAYYRRVRILTDPRKHLFSLIHARIYLIKTLQVVFHNALQILNIEPIKEM